MGATGHPLPSSGLTASLPPGSGPIPRGGQEPVAWTAPLAALLRPWSKETSPDLVPLRKDSDYCGGTRSHEAGRRASGPGLPAGSTAPATWAQPLPEPFILSGQSGGEGTLGPREWGRGPPRASRAWRPAGQGAALAWGGLQVGLGRAELPGGLATWGSADPSQGLRLCGKPAARQEPCATGATFPAPQGRLTAWVLGPRGPVSWRPWPQP